MQTQLRSLIKVKFLTFANEVLDINTGICPNCHNPAINIMKCGYGCGHIFCGTCAIYNPQNESNIAFDSRFIKCPGCYRELKL